MNHVIIFSDKDCDFPSGEDIDVGWKRWYKRAIKRAADQVFGAERWIRTQPHRLYLDPACTQRYPIDLPAPEDAIFHRVVVAHGSIERSIQELGGSGTLMITPSVVGDDHQLPTWDGGKPFTIGQVNPDKGYVHVLDDASLELVLGELDTVTDFVEYLTKKEEVILSGILWWAAGEEELLAHYMQHLNVSGKKDFVLPDDIGVAVLREGLWAKFATSPPRLRRIRADRVSYHWDAMIERFNHHFHHGTQHWASDNTIESHERIVRFLARENRTRRRMLSEALLEQIERTSLKARSTRTMLPSYPGDPYYVFFLLPELPGRPYDEYREIRRTLLADYCMLTKLEHPNATGIVGIATETGNDPQRSEDSLYMDGRNWTEEYQAEAQRLRREFEDYGLIGQRVESRATIYEFPPLEADAISPQSAASHASHHVKGRDRNKPCPCGSGKKYKHCCARAS